MPKTTSSWPRVIAHVDMDAFFAAIEVLRNPELKGKPVIVGADPRKGQGRGVVSTASYEARKFGVHSAMPVSRAYKLCPEGIFVSPKGGVYGDYSRRVFEVLESFTPQIQKVSVDEAFLDLTGSIHLYGSVEAIGKAIKAKVLAETQLYASVGIAPTKSVAKIASDYQKPDGLTIVLPDQVQDFLDPLPVSKIWGVGNKSNETLAHLGIRTVRDLRALSREFLDARFGKMGGFLYRMARGIDERDVHDRDPVKSVSNERTFGSDQDDPEVIHGTLLYLSEKVASRLRHQQIKGRTINLKLRFADFSTSSRSKTILQATNLTEDIYKICLGMLETFNLSGKKVRLIGVGVSHLENAAGIQTNFLDQENEKKSKLEAVLDQLQDRFGKTALTHAQTLNARKRRKDHTDSDD